MTPTASLLQAVSQYIAPRATGPQPPTVATGTPPPVKAEAPMREAVVLKQPLPANGPPDLPTRRGAYLDVTA